MCLCTPHSEHSFRHSAQTCDQPMHPRHRRSCMHSCHLMLLAAPPITTPHTRLFITRGAVSLPHPVIVAQGRRVVRSLSTQVGYIQVLQTYRIIHRFPVRTAGDSRQCFLAVCRHCVCWLGPSLAQHALSWMGPTGGMPSGGIHHLVILKLRNLIDNDNVGVAEHCRTVSSRIGCHENRIRMSEDLLLDIQPSGSGPFQRNIIFLAFQKDREILCSGYIKFMYKFNPSLHIRVARTAIGENIRLHGLDPLECVAV